MYVLDNKFESAAVWMFLGAVFSFFGVIHSYKIVGNEIKPGLVSAPREFIHTCRELALSHRCVWHMRACC